MGLVSEITFHRFKLFLRSLLGRIRYHSVESTLSSSNSEVVPAAVDLVLVMATHRRLKTSCFVIRHFIESANLLGVDVGVIVVLSDPEELDALESQFISCTNIKAFLVANNPLGRKWNLALNFVRRSFDTESVLICGSDDVISPAYLEFAVGVLKDESGISMIGTNVWNVESVDGEVYRVRYTKESTNRVLGSGRFYSRPFLDAVDWKLFSDYLDKGLDFLGYLKAYKTRGFKLMVCESLKSSVLSIKGDWEMITSFDLLRKSRSVDLQKLINFEAHRCLDEYRLR